MAATADKPKRRKTSHNGNAKSTGKSRRDQRQVTEIGRPTLCTDARADKIIESIRQGLTLSDAAKLAGIHPQTVRQWVAKGYGEKECPDDAPYREFVERLQEAKASIKQRLLGNVNRIADGESRAALTANQWLLGVLDRKRYGDQKRVEHSGTVRHESVNLQIGATVPAGQLSALAGLLGVSAHENATGDTSGGVIDIEPAESTEPQ